MVSDPHEMQPTVSGGEPLASAKGVVVAVHGRGAYAGDMISLAEEFEVKGLAILAPEAAKHTWYPNSFLAPLETNQPELDSALALVERIVAGLVGQGFASEKIGLLGFSQGACLVSEFVARHPRRYGAVMALTGGLIGPAGTKRDYAGSLEGVPVFLGTSDPDPHVPFERVESTAEVFRRMGADVEVRRYPGMPHTINGAEIEACRKLLQGMLAK
jgi:predicted esterase